MYQRNLLSNLKYWKEKSTRKPLIIRGARQVGKTTLVNQFSIYFDHFISLNLDLQKDSEVFEHTDDVHKIIRALFLRENLPLKKGKTVLIFIDEIQNSEKAVKILRYFYEEAPELFVIAAGSLLETLLETKISFPVGRVEYMVLRPFSFDEFLLASKEGLAVNLLNEIPFPEYGHQKMLEMFRVFCLVGGMPEVVQVYLENKDIVSANEIFGNLLTTYLDDVEKYAEKYKLIHVLRHVIKSAITHAGERVKFEGFGASNYKSREIGEAFRLLEKTMLLSLVYPTTTVCIPIIANMRKSPKLQILDTGMMSFFAGIQTALYTSTDICEVFEGKVAEHFVGQELISKETSPLYKNAFWVKEQKHSSAEVDYVIQYKELLIPIEVKLAKTGRLRSLMEFIDLCPHNFGVRIYSGRLQIDKVTTLRGKKFFLLNLPFYLTSSLKNYLNWFIDKNK